MTSCPTCFLNAAAARGNGFRSRSEEEDEENSTSSSTTQAKSIPESASERLDRISRMYSSSKEGIAQNVSRATLAAAQAAKQAKIDRARKLSLFFEEKS